MATIGGLSSNATGASSIRGYGGLASGLDRDSLIESMTYATTSKITAKQQEKQKIAWKQEAMRGITDKLYGFSQGFMSYTSSKNLLSSKLFQASTITGVGSNSKYISVSGNSTTAGSMSIAGVKQLASNARSNFTTAASDQTMASEGINEDLRQTKDFNTIAGTSMTVKYGSKYYSVILPEDGEGYSYDSAEDVKDSLVKAMGEVSIGDGKKLSDVISVTNNGEKLTFASTDTAGNKIELVGSSDGLLTNLGFTEYTDGTTTEITASGISSGTDMKRTESRSIADQIGGKKLCFSYNGKSEWITLASAEDLKADGDGLKTLVDDLQTKLDKAFGTGRVKVDRSAAGTDAGGNVLSSLTFTTTVPGTNGASDGSSVLAITAGEKGLLGKYGALTGIASGDSNRLNLDSKLEDAGLNKTGKTVSALGDSSELIINGVKIDVTKDSSIREIIDAVNKSEAGVKLSYLSEADRFVITSTDDGASGSVKVEGDIGKYIFGEENTHYTTAKGQDAIVAVKYEGSDDIVEITRGSNSFNLNGLTITAKGVFGYKEATNADGTPILDSEGKPKIIYDSSAEEVSFDVTMDTEPAAAAVKEMIEAFNEIVKLVNDEVSTKPNRSYSPLTSEQEDDMSESQIEAWNEKAKAGLLFNDSDIRGLADGLRSLVSSDAAAMKKLGITVSTTYSDNGKLVFDEETFKSALATDPDAVIDAFTRQASTVESDDGTVTDPGGLMVRLHTLTEKYASTTGATKGILIERAGSKYAPTSIISNSMQKQMDDIDDVIERLFDKLETEQDRYIAQFTSLETLISQMNSQSSWLSSALGA